MLNQRVVRRVQFLALVCFECCSQCRAFTSRPQRGFRKTSTQKMSPEEFGVSVMPMLETNQEVQGFQTNATPTVFEPVFDIGSFVIFSIFVGLFLFETTLNNLARERRMNAVKLDVKERQRLSIMLMGKGESAEEEALEKEIEELKAKGTSNYVTILGIRLKLFKEPDFGPR
mmetsp:Transcript_6634/g.10967  ORF Transcript_6634/g.10967 Transcript_6634/m.10967 type:complete len:172 (-) Transcript_6634:527-1042(-)